MFSKASKWTFSSFHPECGRWCYTPGLGSAQAFVPQQDCVLYLSGTGVIEMWWSSLSRDCLRFSHTPSILSSDSRSFGLKEWSFWSFFKLPWQRLVGYCDSTTVSPQSEQIQESHFNIFLITLPGGTSDWTPFEFYCIPHICIKTLPWSYFGWFHKLTTIIHRNWNKYYSRRRNCISYAHYILLSQGLCRLTKHQHASLEFIVDVVLLLWVATKIVMSCPHLTVTGSTCVWEGASQKNTISLWFKWLYLVHFTSKIQMWRNTNLMRGDLVYANKKKRNTPWHVGDMLWEMNLYNYTLIWSLYIHLWIHWAFSYL